MSSHLEVSKPSGRELVPLSGQRVTLGKASTNAVSLEHDETVSRLHAILENHRVRLVDTRCGQPQRHVHQRGEDHRRTRSAFRRRGAHRQVTVGLSGGQGVRRTGSMKQTIAARRRPAPAAADPARSRRARGVVPAPGLRRPVSRAARRFGGWRASCSSPRPPSNSICRTCTTSSPSPPRETAGCVWPTRRFGAAPSRSPSCATAAAQSR